MKNTLLKLVVMPLAQILAAQVACAQAIGCAATDNECLQILMERECREAVATRSSCEAWLRRLESHAFASEPAWRLTQGWTYMALSDFATLRALKDYGSVTEPEAAAFRERAKEIFRNVAENNPDDAEALLSLATQVESPEERIVLLRKVVALTPSNFIAVESLANNLKATKGDAANLEVAEILDRAFTITDILPKKWDLAAKADMYYERSGNQSRRDEFRSKVANAAGLNVPPTEILKQSAESLSWALAARCEPAIIDMFAGDECMKLIDQTMAAIGDSQLLASKMVLAEIVTSGMISAGRSDRLRAEQPAWESLFRDHIESLRDSGLQFVLLYDAYANLLTGELHVQALEDALRLAPESGEYSYRLALAYMEQEHWDKAISQFQHAKRFLPEWRQPMLEQHVQLATQRLAEQ